MEFCTICYPSVINLFLCNQIDLLAVALGEVMKRSGVDKGEVEDVITGCVSPVLLQGANIGRFALSKAGFPSMNF
jgi:acetyl-CoA acetyltransferase